MWLSYRLKVKENCSWVSSLFESTFAIKAKECMCYNYILFVHRKKKKGIPSH